MRTKAYTGVTILLGAKNTYPTLIRMASPDSIQSEALIALVEEQGWKRMAILTSNTDYGLSVSVGC